MRGEELESADVTERGIQGDRAYAVVDESSGKVSSAKNPREWGILVNFKTTLVDGEKVPAVQIKLPDGSVVSSRQNDVGQRLSAALGKRVPVLRLNSFRIARDSPRIGGKRADRTAPPC